MTPDPQPNELPVPPAGGAGNFCPVCGLLLARLTAPESCPRCLLGAGLRPTDVPVPGPSSLGSERLGPYQLRRRLGIGGMGEVHEADDLETGRRVALKILKHRLDSPDARRRFLNEGRLAAAINHPNSVYIFGSEEISGVPVISMELMPGGTLEDKIRTHGPMAVADAVDAILQIIDGLAAAQSAGILHRDIKPSNCFIDDDGVIKIGDYGLSISIKGSNRANMNDESGFMGTPAYASPEQLRGNDLTVRSDIYSLGVTFYCLLAGKPPFVSGDTIRLLARVLESPPPDLSGLRRDIPRKVSAAVMRCLAKSPDDRFASYQDLRDAIVGFSAGGTCPAEPWQRLGAGTIDMIIFGAPVLALIAGFHGSEFTMHGIGGALLGSLFLLVVYSLPILFLIASHAFLEWKFGQTPGKACFKLEVLNQQSDRSGRDRFFSHLARSGLFVVFPILVTLSVTPDSRTRSHDASPTAGRAVGHEGISPTASYHYQMYGLAPTHAMIWIGGICLLFAGARRRNGWTALHDAFSSTRVVARHLPRARAPVNPDEHDDAPIEPLTLGPFHILETMPGNNDWLIGYDPRLLRKIWLCKTAAHSPEVPSDLRNLRRAGRLRWLAGMRSAKESWDAYEYPGGQALVDFAQKTVSWEELSGWMMDIATELNAAKLDGTLRETPSPDEIWITREGRAKVLDFRAPGSTNVWASGGSLWAAMADRLLISRPQALPIQDFLGKLPQIHEPSEIASMLNALKNVATTVGRAKHLGIIVVGAAGPGLFALACHCFKGTSPHLSLFVAMLTLVICVALPAIIAAAIAGEGLVMRAMGVAIVDRNGRSAAGRRSVRRALMAWFPTLVSPVVFGVSCLLFEAEAAAWIVIDILMLAALLSALVPGRSLHDRLAGTWLIPR